MKLRILNQSAFTVVELMIAISILATILVMASVVMIGIGSIYQKGVTVINLQNSTRNVLDEMSSDIQLNGANPVTPIGIKINNSGVTATMYAICLGNVRYSYYEYNSSMTILPKYDLWKDTMTSSASCAPLNLWQTNPSCLGSNNNCLPSSNGSGQDLLGDNTHIFNLTASPIDNSTNVYRLEFQAVYTSSGDLLSNNNTCINNAGQQFCATSSLSTIVTRRLR